MQQDICELTRSCIHCILSQWEERIPAPLATALHGSKHIEVVHSVILYISAESRCSLKYILMIQNDLIPYTWLHLCDNVDSDAATTAIAKYIKWFWCMQWLVTNWGAHFVVSLMNKLALETGLRHHSTGPCSLVQMNQPSVNTEKSFRLL